MRIDCKLLQWPGFDRDTLYAFRLHRLYCEELVVSTLLAEIPANMGALLTSKPPPTPKDAVQHVPFTTSRDVLLAAEGRYDSQ
jgi:hypothetical protein